MQNTEDPNKQELSAWLDKIQIESWQLELILSGFVIFLLLAGLEPYHALHDDIVDLGRQSFALTIIELPYHVFRAAYYTLIIATILHVFLRGLWISSIGLRSVSGDIEWDKLKLSDKYDSFLKKKIPSFDGYILQLDKLCSVSFAYMFLLVFSILSTGSFILIGVAIQQLFRAAMGYELYNDSNGTSVDDIALMIYFAFGLLYLVDFISFGWFKRFRIWGKIYYPIYRFFGFITFANFYRPIYYNLIDNKLGRKLALTVLPLGIAIITLMSLRYTGNAYMSSVYTNDHWYLYGYYEDNASGEVTEDKCSIQSKVIGDNYIRLFAPYIPKDHDGSLAHFCPDVEPGYHTGFKTRGAFSAGDIRNPESDTEQLLDCMTQLWRVAIDDSIHTEVNFRFYYHPQREQYGLLAMIPIHELDYTEHFIRVDRHRYLDEELKWYDGENLWFYKE